MWQKELKLKRRKMRESAEGKESVWRRRKRQNQLEVSEWEGGRLQQVEEKHIRNMKPILRCSAAAGGRMTWWLDESRREVVKWKHMKWTDGKKRAGEQERRQRVWGAGVTSSAEVFPSAPVVLAQTSQHAPELNMLTGESVGVRKQHVTVLVQWWMVKGAVQHVGKSSSPLPVRESHVQLDLTVSSR